MKFVNRELELRLLHDSYARDGAQLLILYGRRRIGKTRLITHWLSKSKKNIPPEKPIKHLYWMASQTSATNHLRSFSQALFQYHNPEARVDPTFSYTSWDAALDEIARLTANERIAFILDEFTYVMQANPEVPSLIQRAWDHKLKDRTQAFIILTGSLAGMIQRHVLDYQAPLYGRATGRIRLQPLPFGALKELLPHYRPDQRVAVYAITGGIPSYIELFDDRLNIIENLRRHIVTPSNIMLGDAAFLLHEQLDEPRNYMAIIDAIASGNYALTDIALHAGIDRTNIVKYLGILQELGYVERCVPATVRRPERSRKGRYVITDAYLRFYYRFLQPNLAFIEQGMVEQAISLLRDHLVDFIGTHTFEELCRDWVAVQADRGVMPFLPERIGSFWSKDAQVDVTAINWRTKEILLGECKWGTNNVGKDTIQKLIEKSNKVLQKNEWDFYYAVFSRRGFTPAAREEAANSNVKLVTLHQIEADMSEWLKQRG